MDDRAVPVILKRIELLGLVARIPNKDSGFFISMLEFGFVVNQIGKSRWEVVDDKRFLVVPIVAIYEGVWNGEFVAANELQASLSQWDGRPVVIEHPKEDGVYVTARKPLIALAQSPGSLFNAEFKGNKLKFEAWLSEERANEIGGDVLKGFNRLANNELTEGSTGYFRKRVPATGEYNGKPYTVAAQNIEPDHYAFLLSGPGACSIDDGCGGPRVNELATNMDVSESVMIAFYLAGSDTDRLSGIVPALPAGSEQIEPNQYHVTLAYCGKKQDIATPVDDILRALGRYASEMPIVRTRLNGLGRFSASTSQSLNPLVAMIDSDYLSTWRQGLMYWLEDIMPVRKDHGFSPHVTLAYVPQGQPVDIAHVEPQEIVFTALALSWGDQTTLFRLQGEDRNEPMVDNEQHTDSEQSPYMRYLKTFAEKFNLDFLFKDRSNNSEDSMNEKQKLVKALMANERCNLPEAVLDGLDTDTLKTLSSDFEAVSGGEAEAEQGGQQDQSASGQPATDESDRLSAVEAAVKKMTESMNLVSGQVGELSKAMAANVAQEKAALVDQITVNQQIYSKEDLEKMDLSNLQKLAALTAPQVPADFSGAGIMTNAMGVAVNAQNGELVSYEEWEKKQNDGGDE